MKAGGGLCVNQNSHSYRGEVCGPVTHPDEGQWDGCDELITPKAGGEPAAKRRSLRLSEKPGPAKAEAKPKPKKVVAKPKKAKEVEKAKPEEKAPEAPAENGEAKAEEEAPTTEETDEKDDAAE
ncbi:hypothetical protein EYF80_013067 [Liparis tanakae]|uniref:Uncharacterized protein n=1 Tax=Liparis tanakae TaxID=230148 RepID=A0A4Z2IG37_9TELE|nr:hypothetical protein EYF80_013067 [Liparis tanakae]